MLGSLFKTSPRPSALQLSQLSPLRSLHSRNKKAMEFLAKGFSAIKEVDRVIDHDERNGHLLIPLLRTAKENFELAVEADNSNACARYWLSKLHLKYQVPGACKAVGAALLVEAADMGDVEAQYELGRRLRYKGHAGAAITYGSLLLRGVEVRESVAKMYKTARRSSGSAELDPVEMAKEQLQIAAKAGCELGFKWFQRIEEEEKRLNAEKDQNAILRYDKSDGISEQK